MLDVETRRRIDTARDILVGKVPDPKSQVEQITIALIYKFMDDMDNESEELGGERKYFIGDFERYAWHKLLDRSLGGFEVLNLYSEAILKMNQNPNTPQLFRDIFKNAFLPYRDPETLKAFLKIINDFNYSHSEKLGDAFEYLLSVLGSQGDAGQFRTPRHIIDFMVEIIAPQKNETILDPACGTAGFLISAYKYILKNNSTNYDPEHDPAAFELHGIRVEELGAVNGKKYKGDKLTPDDRTRLVNNIRGYDISPDMVRLSLVNLYLHGFKDPHIFEYDTLTSEDRWNEYADVILANPPFMSPKGGIRPHKRFSVSSSRSEVLFVDYMAEHLTPTGKAAIVVPEGIIFQSGTAYKSLRKMLVDENYLVGVISLPSGVFNPYSGVKTSILWLDRSLAKRTDKILFVKINNDGFDLGAQRRPIKENEMPEAFQQIARYKQDLLTGELAIVGQEEGFRFVEKSKIGESGDYNLSGERYLKKESIHSSYPLVMLADVAQYVNGFPFKPKDWHGKGREIIRIQDLTGSGKRINKTLRTDIPEKYIVRKGDLLISWSATIGFYKWLSEDEAYLNQHIFKVIPKPNLNIDYLYWIGYKISNQILKEVHGNTMTHITKGRFNSIQIPLPPLSIQNEIVHDIKEFKLIIDGARQVVENWKPRIDIDPGWPVVELGEICKLAGGGTPSRQEKSYWENGGIKWISSKHINEEGKVTGYELITDEGLRNSSANVVQKGSTIAITRVSVGKIAYADDDYAVNQDLTGLTIKDATIVNEKYLFFSVKELGPVIDKNAQGLGVRGVTRDYLSKLTIPLPDLDTQIRIVEDIEKEEQVSDLNKVLIQRYEQKIKDRITRVWGE